MESEETYQVFPIGHIRRGEDTVVLEVDEKYRPALLELDNFSHVVVVWWADRYEEYRHQVDMQMNPPYAPDVLTGLFATRSPLRPNPVMVTTCKVLAVDQGAGIVKVNEIDAFDGTPLLDLKVYFPPVDRVKDAVVPDRFKEWGDWYPEEGQAPEYYG